MPGDSGIPLLGQSYWGSELSKSILNGTVPVDRLNDMVRSAGVGDPCGCQVLIYPRSLGLLLHGTSSDRTRIIPCPTSPAARIKKKGFSTRVLLSRPLVS